MKTIAVKELMVPLNEYATVSEDATLFEAVLALERAQDVLDRKRYRYLHRAVLVYDKNNKIKGKISQLDALRALEPKYEDIGDIGRMSRAGFSTKFLKSLLQKESLWDRPLRDICAKGASMRVKAFMHIASESEYIDEDASLDEAIHQLVMGDRQSLLATRGKEREVVGVLRLTDVFLQVFQMMKECEI